MSDADGAPSDGSEYCPHCGLVWDFEWLALEADSDSAESLEEWRLHPLDRLSVWRTQCPSCHKTLVEICEKEVEVLGVVARSECHVIVVGEWRTQPSPVLPSARQLPAEVPDDLARDYNEAAATLPISPRASAALARRCLQHFCVDYLNAPARDLDKSIAQVVASGRLSHLNRAFDAVRVLGNLAAHPTKSSHTGALVEVESGEAEAILAVLHEAFDAHWGAPARAEQIRLRINEKLVEAGREPLPE